MDEPQNMSSNIQVHIQNTQQIQIYIKNFKLLLNFKILNVNMIHVIIV